MIRSLQSLIAAFILFTQFNLFAQGSKTQIFNLLTGGPDSTAGKTWRIERGQGAMRLGPLGDTTGGYFSYFSMEEPPLINGMLNNSYNFKSDSIYTPENNNATINYLYANKVFGMMQSKYSDIAKSDIAHKSAPFSLTEDHSMKNTTNFRIDIKNGSYIGYFEERSSYYIASINTNSMLLCQTYDDQNGFTSPKEDTLYRCIKFTSARNTLTAIDNIAFEENKIFYPNPVVSELHFGLTLKYSVFNTLGEEILNGEASQVNVSSLLPGNYLIKYTDLNDKIRVRKFSKE